MKKVKKDEPTKKEETKSEIKSFSRYKKARMVRLSGNFMGGGFNISQNKVKAILDNKEMLEKFVNGKFDKEIDDLLEDEILEV